MTFMERVEPNHQSPIRSAARQPAETRPSSHRWTLAKPRCKLLAVCDVLNATDIINRDTSYPQPLFSSNAFRRRQICVEDIYPSSSRCLFRHCLRPTHINLLHTKRISAPDNNCPLYIKISLGIFQRTTKPWSSNPTLFIISTCPDPQIYQWWFLIFHLCYFYQNSK